VIFSKEMARLMIDIEKANEGPINLNANEQVADLVMKSASTRARFLLRAASGLTASTPSNPSIRIRSSKRSASYGQVFQAAEFLCNQSAESGL